MNKPTYGWIVRCGDEYWKFDDNEDVTWVKERSGATRMTKDEAEIVVNDYNVEFEDRGELAVMTEVEE